MNPLSNDDFLLILTAAKSGDLLAMIMAGNIYYKGIGQKADLDKALLWFYRVSKSHDIDVLRKLSAELNLNTVRHTKVPVLSADYLNERELRKNILVELVSIKLNSTTVGRLVYNIIRVISELSEIKY